MGRGQWEADTLANKELERNDIMQTIGINGTGDIESFNLSIMPQQIWGGGRDWKCLDMAPSVRYAYLFRQEEKVTTETSTQIP